MKALREARCEGGSEKVLREARCEGGEEGNTGRGKKREDAQGKMGRRKKEGAKYNITREGAEQYMELGRKLERCC